MPTYEYRCNDCSAELEVVQKFTDPALTECPRCDDGTLRKVFNAVGVVFKGSGFYRTDSRAKESAGKSDSKQDSKGDSTSGSKNEAKKEPAKASSTASSSTD